MNTRLLTPAVLCLAAAAWLNASGLSSMVTAADSPQAERILTLDEWVKSNSSQSEAPAQATPTDPQAAQPQAATADTESNAPTDPDEPSAAPIMPVGFETPASAPATQTTSAESDPTFNHSTVQRLLHNARAALGRGNLRQAHVLAEAAAEMSIPFPLFEKHAVEVLDEIAFVTAKQNPISTMAYTQPAAEQTPAPGQSQPAPYTDPTATQTDEENAEEREFRAIGPQSLSIRPLVIDKDGNRQELPERRARRKLALTPDVAHTMGFSRDWEPLAYSWDAPVVHHQPLYFEDVELERYGNEYCLIQPFVSGARFYGTFATLPYQASIPDNAWFHNVHDLGHNRPGNSSPYALHTLPVDWTAGLSASGIITGIVFALMTP